MIRLPVPSDHTPETAVLQIGPHSVATRVVLAPMVGVTDQPFRQLCARLGTRLGIAEMISADRKLWGTRKSLHRLTGRGGFPLLWVQIAGNDPAQMADAARAQARATSAAGTRCGPVFTDATSAPASTTWPSKDRKSVV